MEKSYSVEWKELINKQKEFEDNAFYYNKIEIDVRRQDLKKALEEKDLFVQLSVVRMMAEGYIYPESLELVLEELVIMAITGHEECAAYAGVALNHLNIKKWKNHIVKYIFIYTEKNMDDYAVFHQAWHLMYKLGLKQALLNYIHKYQKYMEDELDEEDLQDINNMYEN